MDPADAHFLSVDDGSLPGTEEEQRALLEEWTTFNLDSYYRFVADLTFETRFVEVDPDLFLNFLSRGVSDENKDCIDALIRSIESAADCERPFFCKLSTRSPKDAVDKLEDKLIDRLCIYLAKTMASGIEINDNVKACCLKQAFSSCMAVNSAHEALDMFGMSERIVADLVRWKRLMSDKGRSLCVVVREFAEIPLHAEFRVFVHKRQMTAASQYFSELYFEELQGKEDEIRERLVQFFQKIDKSLPQEYQSFILDVCVDLSTAENTKLIELNPFGRLTGGALFDWEQDRDVLHKTATGLFEIRMRKKPQSLTLTGSWKKAVDKALEELCFDIETQFEDNTVIL